MKSLKRRYIHPSRVIKDIDCDRLKGAKVTFVNMPIREKAKPNNPPIGLAYLAGRLINYGVEVSILDLNVYRKENNCFFSTDEILKVMIDFFRSKPDQDLVGLSGLITTLRWQIEVASIVRALQPKAVIASGGGLATEFKEVLFSWIPELDAVAHSEGDDVILKMAYDAKIIRDYGLLHSAEMGKLDPYLIEIIDGRPVFFYDGGRPENLDSLPFPHWESLGSETLSVYLENPVWGVDSNNSSATDFSMKRSISMVSSRGCPFNCKFCYRGAQGERHYGARSAENIVSEIKTNADKWDVDFVGIVDDNFMVIPERCEKMVPLMRDVVASGVKWGTHGRLDEAADIKPSKIARGGILYNRIRRVDEMAAAGCVYIGFGGESASAKVLQRMGKGGLTLKNGVSKISGYQFPRSYVWGLKNTLDAGIHPNCTWIMGYPGETLQDLKTTVAFIEWQRSIYNDCSTVNQNLFVATAYPGTELFKEEKVQQMLTKIFGIKFDKDCDFIPDENLKNYVLALDDATKLLTSVYGEPVNYSDMSESEFLQAKALVENGETLKILEL